MATLIEMSQGHVPVLASELIALLDPRPGEVAVDCTLGGGGHARAVGALLGPEGTLVAIDRDPAAADAFEALARRVDAHPQLGHDRAVHAHAPSADQLLAGPA